MEWRQLTPAQLGEILERSSKGHVSDVLSGKKRLGLDSALLLCERYGVTLDWIYRGDYGSLPLRTEIEIRSKKRAS
jgi:antitoxin component HigA of HigAB toxin-antitoxin module